MIHLRIHPRILKPSRSWAVWVLLLCLCQFYGTAQGEETSVQVKTGEKLSSDSSDAITVKKGLIREPDFEIINGESEIFGEPEMGLKEAFQTWKTACTAWKKEMKDQNTENNILALNCNAPSATRDKVGSNIYRSVGTYKLKVRIRDAHSNH